MKQILGTLGLAVAILVLSLSAYAGERPRKPMTPEMAAKREMVRKQQKQRITHEQRKTAADALKTERIKIYNAKHGAQ